MSTDLFELSGRTALVSGASRGIGEAIARLLAAQGARVVCTSRKLEGCEAVAASIRDNGGQARALAMHVGDPAAIEAAFAALDADDWTPDILVNNAAANPYFGPMLEQDLGSFEKTVEVNLRGYFWSCVQAARRMKARDAGGCIVNLTEGLAKELARDGIRVNAVLPGLTDTKFASALTSNPKILGMMMQLTPLGRVAQPDEIAPAVLYLCSAASSYVTGSVLAVDGGYLA